MRLRGSQVTTIAGSTTGYADGFALSAMFSDPNAVATDAGGNIFISDYQNNRIRRIDWLTRMVSTVAGSGKNGVVNAMGTLAQFNGPYGLTMYNGSIYLVDLLGDTVRNIGMVEFY